MIVIECKGPLKGSIALDDRGGEGKGSRCRRGEGWNKEETSLIEASSNYMQRESDPESRRGVSLKPLGRRRMVCCAARERCCRTHGQTNLRRKDTADTAPRSNHLEESCPAFGLSYARLLLLHLYISFISTLHNWTVSR